MTISGYIANKQIIKIEGLIQCTEEGVFDFISSFNILSVARAISDLGNQIFKRKNKSLHFLGFPVTVDFLLFSMHLLLKSKSNGKLNINQDQLLHYFKLTRHLYDESILCLTTDPNELLLIYANKSFLYQENLLNAFARSLYIYKYLWNTISSISVEDLFNETLGLDLNTLLVHFSYLIGSKDSYFYKLPIGVIEEMNKSLRFPISLETQDKFILWSSANRDKLLDYNGSLDNPLIKYPVFDTQFIPEVAQDSVYLIISKTALYLKFSYSLYFDFIEKYNSGKGANKFKENYGIVFQEYVGVIIKAHFKNWRVIPEIKYRKLKNFVDSVDWVIFKDNKAVLIEIKQSSIFLKTRQSGCLKSLKDDLRKTIGKASLQLKTTQHDILSKKYSELHVLNDIKYFQKLCIVADQFYFGNYYLNKVSEEYKDIHVINITDFENILVRQKRKESLYYLLNEKKERMDYSILDFNEYYNVKYGKRKKVKSMELLDRVTKEFYENIKQ